ncbi:DUF4387 domain-containing protein [Nocardia sp. FBN12]|uniref:DUF4387 domain-containing protein n=1 Tax=Nocardia sp. FBN12 TaxID=3419766 RepID=UPI003D03C072
MNAPMPVHPTDASAATTALKDLAQVIRSKNAGPFELTFDVMFSEAATYALVRDSGVLTPARMAELYGIDETAITYCAFFEPALAFKLTIVRSGYQGSVDESDTFGAQQHAPLLALAIPTSRRGGADVQHAADAR